MTFSASAYQNEYLPEGATEVHAVVTVTSEGGVAPASASGTERAVVLIVDSSGSMNQPSSKIRAAREALAVAISELPDGTWFAVIAGSDLATPAYPPVPPGGVPQLVEASDRTRSEATSVARFLVAQGGTAISTWLDLALVFFASRPNAIKLAYLLTDGQNQHESPETLAAALARCSGVFQCDARGVGADWRVAELRQITSALLGEVDIIKSPDEMDEDFHAFLERAMGKTVADVRLRLWAPQGATVQFVRQVAPTIEDLTDRATAVSPLIGDFPTGAWAGAESRDYHVCVKVAPGAVGEERLAARVSLMVGDLAVSQALVRAIWTNDEAQSARIDPAVAHYTGQAELAAAIREGLDARTSGDDRTATIKLGRAVQLANASGNDGTVRLLQKVVDVEDPATGTVRLKRDVEALDEMALDTRSTRTVRVTKAANPAPPAPGAGA